SSALRPASRGSARSSCRRRTAADRPSPPSRCATPGRPSGSRRSGRSRRWADTGRCSSAFVSSHPQSGNPFGGSYRGGSRMPDGRVVVVTGGSAGVGRATVRAFADNGDDVAILARGGDGLDAAAKEVEAEGRRGCAVDVDVADAGAVEAAAAEVEDALGPIDVWVNCAMTSVFAPFKDVYPDEIRRVTEVDYLGFAYGTKAALNRMLPRDRGVIVQV